MSRREDAGAHPSLKTVVARVVDDGKAFIDAELHYVLAELGARRALAVSGLIAGTTAFIFAFGAIVALLIGLMLALATMIALWKSVLVVAGAALLLSAIIMLWSKARLIAAFKPLEDK